MIWIELKEPNSQVTFVKLLNLYIIHLYTNLWVVRVWVFWIRSSSPFPGTKVSKRFSNSLLHWSNIHDRWTGLSEHLNRSPPIMPLLLVTINTSNPLNVLGFYHGGSTHLLQLYVVRYLIGINLKNQLLFFEKMANQVDSIN